MKTNKLFGMITLIAGVMLVFSFTACDEGNDDNNNNNNNNNNGGNYVVTIQNNTSSPALVVHSLRPNIGQNLMTYTVAKNAAITMQIRQSGSGNNTLDAEDYDVRILGAATAFTGTAKEVQFTNMGQTNSYHVLEYTFTVTADITLVISRAP